MANCELCNGKGFVKVSTIETATCTCVTNQDLTSRIINSGIPKKMLNFDLHDWNSRQNSDGSDLSPAQIKTKSEAFKIITTLCESKEFPRHPCKLNNSKYYSCIFTGPKRSGRTMVLSILGRDAVSKGFNVKYYDFSNLVAILERFDNRSELDEIVSEFETADLILIDDVTSFDSTIQGRNQLNRLFKKRDNDMLWTVVSSASASPIKHLWWDNLKESSCVVALL